VRTSTAPSDAAWFADWLTRTIEAASARDDYNTAEEKRATLDYLNQAREAYRTLAGNPTPSEPRRGTR
jgi:hypothetical protein